MNIKMLSLATLAFSMSLSQPILACSDSMKSFTGDRLEKWAEQLGLNVDQKKKIMTIRDQARHGLLPQFEKLHTLRHQSNELLMATTLDESALDGIIAQEKEVLGSIMKTRAMERRDILNVLTTQQKAKFTEMIRQWEQKHQENIISKSKG